MKVNIIVHIWLLYPFLVIGQNGPLKFKHLSLENGLSQSSITCILKDSRGFMWFGTEDGLNKYDGKNFTIYRHIPNDKNSLSSSYINTIIEQEDGFLWVGTRNGLNAFNPDKETFTRYMQDKDEPGKLFFDHIVSLYLNEEKDLLVGTSGGLHLFNPEEGFSNELIKGDSRKFYTVAITKDHLQGYWALSSDRLEKIQYHKGSYKVVGSYKILNGSKNKCMLLDSTALWIGSNSGLIKFNLEDKTFKIFKFNGSESSGDLRNNIEAIEPGKTNNLWLATSGGGLVNFNKQSGQFEAIVSDPLNRLSLNSNAIKSIFIDESDILWLGTFGGGINKHDPNQFKFEHYKQRPGDKFSLSNNGVRSILRDSQGELWVGTYKGLNRMNPQRKELKVYTHDKNKATSISSNVVRSLFEDINGNIWAGTWEKGLNMFNKQLGTFVRYNSLPGSNDTLKAVRAIVADSKNMIWFGGNGLWRYNPFENEFQNEIYSNENKYLKKIQINSLHFDKIGRLWMGTYNSGLVFLEPQTNQTKSYMHDANDNTSLSHNNITCIAEDKMGFLWVGTYGGGLNVLDVSKGTFERFETTNGLLNDVIYGILIDDQGFVWFSSNAGLCRFDPVLKSAKYFGIEHGIQSAEFNAGAYFKSAEDEFFFGGINGFNSFFPNSIYSSTKSSNIVFTDFQLLDEKGNLANKFLANHISRTMQIKLDHDQNTFSLSFAELNYAENVHHSYQYQLEGYEKNWQDLGGKNEIRLGNLKQGDYTLHVRVHNDPRERASLQISVLPAPWRTRGAYAAYFIIIVLILGAVYRNSIKNREIRRQFELKIKNWELEANGHVQLQKKGGTLTTSSLNKIEASSVDDKFLKRVTEVVEEHMEDSQFNVEKFAAEMFLSRSQLHRKLKALTGYSTTEFIRLIRLKRAAQLLAANSGTVSEIAYKVGFDNIGYFSKCFRETFGRPPSQYTLD